MPPLSFTTLEVELLNQKIAHLRADLTMDRPISKETAEELLALAETLMQEVDDAYQAGYDAGQEEAEATEELSAQELEDEYDRGYDDGYNDGKEDAEVA